MNIEHIRPDEIEKRSLEIISENLSGMDVVINGNERIDTSDPVMRPVLDVIKRCIHTTADFDYARSMCFSEGAVDKLKALISSGATVVTDTNMAYSGINRSKLSSFGCDIHCFMADEEVAKEAKIRGITRAHVSMERAMALPGPVIFVIGNAPTALITLKEHYDRKDYMPAFVIGVPVGFVNVVAAKEMMIDTDIPYIVNSGRKGGSNVAAAIFNSVLYGMPSSGNAQIQAKGCGFTTGSCAAAAAAAAAGMIFEKCVIDRVAIRTPSGAVFDTEISDVMLTKDDDGSISSVSCAVKKPKSDDPDVTAGMLIYARAKLICADVEGSRVVIEGGPGIGKVNKPGLDQPVGEYAINSVPRKMIEQEVMSVLADHEYKGGIHIEIYAPDGEKAAKNTFNERLGIKGGISVIGTSGLVEPMSTKAVLDTIRVELRQKKELGAEVAIVSPGNYGIDFMRKNYGFDLDDAVKCSNYIGETADIAESLGFSALLIAGHLGKLIKLAGGIMNTHSHEADCRMELMAAAAIKCGASSDVAAAILSCVSTEEAYRCMIDAGIEKECGSYILDRIMYHLRARSKDMEIGCIVFTNEHGLICESENAKRLMRLT